ncbi:hypothetical protein [Actinopolyspora halophila]|nr:hypothetical protein [Actinopolyspora halophila]
MTLFGTEVVHLGSSGATRRLPERVLGEATALTPLAATDGTLVVVGADE